MLYVVLLYLLLVIKNCPILDPPVIAIQSVPSLAEAPIATPSVRTGLFAYARRLGTFVDIHAHFVVCRRVSESL